MPPHTKARYFSASSLLFTARAVGAAAMFGAQILLARTTSADTLALFFLATSLATVAGIVAARGYPNIVVAILGRYQGRRDLQRADAFVATARRDAMITGALLALVLGLGILAYPFASWAERASFLAALPAIPAVAMIRTNDVVARARSMLATAYLTTNLWRPLFFLFLAMFAVWVLHRSDAITYIALFSAIAVVGAAVQASKFPETKAAAVKTDKRLSRLWRRTAAGFIAISMADLLVIDLDVLLAGTLLPREQLAVFAICMKLAFFAKFAVDILQELVGPDMARCYARGDTAALRRNIALSNLAALVSTLAMVVGVVLFGRTALAFFGPDYVAGTTALTTLIAVHVVNALGGPHVILLTLNGAQRRINIGYAAAGAVLVVLTVVLAPIYGIFGAALAVLAAYVTLNLILAVSVWRLMGIRSDVWTFIQLYFERPPAERPRTVG